MWYWLVDYSIDLVIIRILVCFYNSNGSLISHGIHWMDEHMRDRYAGSHFVWQLKLSTSCFGIFMGWVVAEDSQFYYYNSIEYTTSSINPNLCIRNIILRHKAKIWLKSTIISADIIIFQFTPHFHSKFNEMELNEFFGVQYFRSFDSLAWFNNQWFHLLPLIEWNES